MGRKSLMGTVFR